MKFINFIKRKKESRKGWKDFKANYPYKCRDCKIYTNPFSLLKALSNSRFKKKDMKKKCAFCNSKRMEKITKKDYEDYLDEMYNEMNLKNDSEIWN